VGFLQADSLSTNNKMAIFGKYTGGIPEAFDVRGNWAGIHAQQKANQEEMIGLAKKFQDTQIMMDELRGKVGGILGAYELGEDGKPDPSAPKYVHDAFNAVKKEGGLAGMSASQMNAVISGYSTGLEADKAKAAAKQNLYNSKVIDRNLRAMEEEDKLNEAYRKTQEEREKVSKEEEKEKKVPTKTQKSYDLTQPGEIARFAIDLADERRSASEGAGVIKPDAFREKQPKAKGGTAGWFNKKPSEIIAEAQAAAATADERARQAEVEAASKEADRRDASAALSELYAKRRGLEAASKQSPVVTNVVTPVPSPSAGMPGGGSRFSGMFRAGPFETTNLSGEQIRRFDEAKQAARLKSIKELEDVNSRIAQLEAAGVTGNPVKDAGEKPIQRTVSAAPATKKKEDKATIEATQYITEREKVQRTQEAILNDEYAIMTAYLKNNGGLPANWSKGSFMQLKGYPSIQTIPIEGVGTYVSINGKGELIKDTPMSIGDRASIRDAAILAQQRTLNGIDLGGNSGYVFTGEIGSNSIGDVNKVREELGKSSIALKNVDTLLRIAEDASMLDKLLPGEITGLAGGISNAIAAANRTEIGGSGAWSEADEARLQLIVRDPTKLRNMAFRAEAVSSLQAYKQRLTDGIKTKGQTYGFRLAGTPQDKRRAEAGIQRARIAYQTAMMSGKTKEEASEIARQSYSQSLE